MRSCVCGKGEEHEPKQMEVARSDVAHLTLNPPRPPISMPPLSSAQCSAVRLTARDHDGGVPVRWALGIQVLSADLDAIRAARRE